MGYRIRCTVTCSNSVSPLSKILIAVSSVGLGHAARARAYGTLLERSGHRVDYYAPEPAGSYISAWGGKVIPYSRKVESLSLYLEKHWLRTGSGLIGLRAALEEHRASLKAGIELIESIDVESYDLLIAEESWEIMSVAERIPIKKAWIADFVGYKPVGFRALLASWLTNRFLLRRYRYFDSRFYVGLRNDMKWRLTPLGPKARDVLNDLFRVIGPIPAILPDELLNREEARKLINLPQDEKIILIQLGGTRAGEDIVEIIVKEALRVGFTPAVATGPRATPRLHEKAINLGYQPKLPVLLKAFDCAYVLAGLSSIVSLAVAGIPAVLHPLPRHFEQEENAWMAPKIWQDLFIKATGNIVQDIEVVCERNNPPPDTSLHHNTVRLVEMLI